MLRWLVPIVLLAATGSIVVTLIPFAAELSWIFELFSHFRLQYLAAQAALLVALIALRKPRWCAAVVLAMVLNAVPISPYLPQFVEPAAGAGTAISDAEAIAVIAVNLGARDIKPDRLLEILAAESPDVLVLIELTPLWQKRLEHVYHKYPHRRSVPRDDAFGLAILSRYPFDRAEPFQLETTAAIDARVRAPRGTFRLIGVHLRPPTWRASAAERNRQLDALAALGAATTGPLVIAGDFNVSPFSPFFSSWLARTGLRSALAGYGPSFTWPTSLPALGIAIDHCVVSKEFVVLDYRRLPAFGSDHYPIIARLALDGPS